MTHTCPKCGAEFTNLVELVAHMNPAYNKCPNNKKETQ